MAVYKNIVGKNVYLRSVEIGDAQFTYDIRQDQERTKYMHQVNGGVENQEEWIKNQREKEGDYFFVVHDINGSPLGTVSIYGIRFERGEGEIGRAILNGNPMQNMEALVLIHEFAFCSLNLNLLRAAILSGNTASIGVTLRFGGVEKHRGYNDEFQSEVIWYDIYKEEYIKRREKFVNLVNRFRNR